MSIKSDWWFVVLLRRHGLGEWGVCDQWRYTLFTNEQEVATAEARNATDEAGKLETCVLSHRACFGWHQASCHYMAGVQTTHRPAAIVLGEMSPALYWELLEGLASAAARETAGAHVDLSEGSEHGTQG